VRDIIRLSITLAVVGILSATLLTGLHNITEPIIIERQEQEYRQALELYFPGFDHFETESVEDDYFDLIYDEAGNLMGLMATIKATGYDGDITYNLAIDSAGEIAGVLIVSHTETPGIGDVITTEPFQEQFIGKSFEDPIIAGEDVDIVTGATVSTAAIINSVRRVVGVVAENYLGHETTAIDISAVPDGTYQGSAPGLGGPVSVEVTVAGGEIVAIEVLDHEETPTYFIEAYPLIPELIIAEQGFDVDTKTGATISAEAIVDAVKDALSGALNGESGGEVENEGE
jgi:Na+-translocating ferredoxin:NAD+ oxidoreductase subunit G